MKKTNLLTKLLLLMVMLVGWTSVSLGQTTLFSMSVDDTGTGSDVSVARQGGTLELSTSNELSAISGGTATIKNINSSSGSDKVVGSDKVSNVTERHLRFPSNNVTLILSLSTPLAEGDVISFTNNGSNQVSITTAETRSTSLATSSGSYTIPANSDLIGKTKIYLWRASGSNTYIKTLSITRTSTPTTAFTVTFNAGDYGTCGTSSLTEASVGAGVTLPAVTPNSGYEFNGWFTAATGGTKVGVANDTYKPASNITLYAQYSAYAAPTIALDKISATIYAGQSVTFTATVAGTPTPTVAWYSCDANGDNLSAEPVATAASYSPAPATEGTYYYVCKATNNYSGEDHVTTSSVVTLTVNAEPTLTAETAKVWDFSDKTNWPNQTLESMFYRDNLIIKASSDKTVKIASSRVELGGAGAADYRNITFKVAGKSRIKVTCVSSSSSDDRTLNVDYGTFGTNLGTISAPKSSAEGYIDYTGTDETTIIIYSTAGGVHVSKIEVEHLSNGPVITTQPTGATYNLDETAAALTVAATSSVEGKALSYQWYSNTANSTTGATAISGANSASYTPSTTTGGTTYYYCVVSEEDNEESTTSNIVAVKVVDLGTLLVTLQPGGNPGNDVTITSFEKNGFTLTNGSSFSYSNYDGFPYNFKVGTNDVVIQAPSWATINSIKVYGFRNGSGTTTVTANTGATVSGNATLQARNTDGDLSEVLIVVDEPAAGNSVSFKVGNQSRIKIEVYGSGAMPEEKVTITSALYKAYNTIMDTDFSQTENLTAYVVSEATATSVKLTEVTAVPTGTPVILKATEAKGYTLVVAESATAPSTNLLQVSNGTVAGDGSTRYALANLSGIGFYLVGDGVTIPTNYIELTSGTPGAPSLSLDFGEGTTGISNVNVNHNDNQWYDLSGRKVENPSKGVYIMNGKKVIVK